MFLKIYSKNYNSEVLVNTARIQFVAPTHDGSIIHFDSGNVLPCAETLEQINQKLVPVEKKALLVEKVEVKSSEVEAKLVEKASEASTDKIWPDEFPDDFPRYKNGTIIKNSKRYIEYMKEKTDV